MKKEVWLNLGCGIYLADKPFINVDKYIDFKTLAKAAKNQDPAYIGARVPKDCAFVQASMTELPFKDNSIDYVESNDSIEHLSWNEVDMAFKEIYRVLKPGGKLGLMTTNFDEVARLWNANITGKKLNTPEEINQYLTLSQVIYGNQSHPGEYHKVPFNPYTLAYRLENAGFNVDNLVIDIYPTGSPCIVKAKAFKTLKEKLKGTFILTEMMWVEVIK